jgi:hypothetical protein
VGAVEREPVDLGLGGEDEVVEDPAGGEPGHQGAGRRQLEQHDLDRAEARGVGIATREQAAVGQDHQGVGRGVDLLEIEGEPAIGAEARHHRAVGGQLSLKL